MKPNSITQSDTNLGFDGAASMSPTRSRKYQTNQHTGYMNDGRLVNKGRGPTVGNKSDDNSTYPDARVMPALPKQGSVRDNINRGPQVRTSGGGRFPETRSWDPVCGQNYKGNADKINVGRGPTKGNQV